jgi:hypothetical protein
MREALDKLRSALCKIAKDRALDHPDMQARIISNRLTRRIERLKEDTFCKWHYDLFIKPSMTERKEFWLCYLVNCAAKKQNTSPAVKKRAVELLGGASKKPRKNIIEKRAIELAEKIEKEWFLKQKRGRPAGRSKLDMRNFKKNSDGLPIFDSSKLPLTPTDVILVATPVVEEFAKAKIGRTGSPFDALYWIVCVYSDDIIKQTTHREYLISRESVRRALNRARCVVKDK